MRKLEESRIMRDRIMRKSLKKMIRGKLEKADEKCNKNDSRDLYKESSEKALSSG